MKPVRAKVTLVRSSPQAEELIASAAKLCYASKTGGILKQDRNKAGRFVAMLRDMGHVSPLEHVAFTFYIEGISRTTSHQLVRHRLASYSQRSQRYVSHRGFDYVVPPALKGKKVTVKGKKVDAVKYFKETMDLLADRYAGLVRALGNTGEASNEDARYILPNACETKLFVTMNARVLLHFFEERLCERAQWEIRQVADLMLKAVKRECPSLFAGIGPKCVQLGKCPEGKMSCGKFAEKKRKYKR